MTEAITRDDAVATHPAGGVSKHLLPPLPYDHAALEPYIDARTMMLHHGKHHASYVEKLNTALETFPDLQQKTALWLLLNLGKLPKEIRVAVRNNAGGHVNHSLFWLAMSPAGGGAPSGPLADAIKRDFGRQADRLRGKFFTNSRTRRDISAILCRSAGAGCGTRGTTRGPVPPEPDRFSYPSWIVSRSSLTSPSQITGVGF